MDLDPHPDLPFVEVGEIEIVAVAKAVARVEAGAGPEIGDAGDPILIPAALAAVGLDQEVLYHQEAAHKLNLRHLHQNTFHSLLRIRLRRLHSHCPNRLWRSRLRITWHRPPLRCRRRRLT